MRPVGPRPCARTGARGLRPRSPSASIRFGGLGRSRDAGDRGPRARGTSWRLRPRPRGTVLHRGLLARRWPSAPWASDGHGDRTVRSSRWTPQAALGRGAEPEPPLPCRGEAGDSKTQGHITGHCSSLGGGRQVTGSAHQLPRWGGCSSPSANR